MDNYIQISRLNDFIFCPKSIYYHSIYESFSESNYHSHFQTVGKINHQNIDLAKYSTASRYLQGVTVYHEKLKLIGKIDIYDQENQCLIERKYTIKKIFDGYKYQIFAQFFSLKEMGFKVKKLFFHSLSDNKRYSVKLPTTTDYQRLSSLCQKIQNYNLEQSLPPKSTSANKCQNCIYHLLCV